MFILRVIDFVRFETRINVDSHNTIQQVKHKIKDNNNIDVDKQELYLGDQKLENEKTLSDYNIGQNDPIRIVLIKPGGFEIYVRLNDRSIALQVKSSYTIEEVKKKYYEKRKIPVNEQRYIYGGKQLEDRRILSDYNIKGSETIHLTLRLSGGI